MERTLVIAKPDAIQRGLAGALLARLEQRGLKIVGMKMLWLDEALARRHYAVHEGKPFFDGLVQYITSCPVIVAVFEGPGAVKAVRKTMGATNPLEAEMGTIRGDLALETMRNLVHGSDSVENAEKEIALFFTEDDLFDYHRDGDRWVTETTG